MIVNVNRIKRKRLRNVYVFTSTFLFGYFRSLIRHQRHQEWECPKKKELEDRLFLHCTACSQYFDTESQFDEHKEDSEHLEGIREANKKRRIEQSSNSSKEEALKESVPKKQSLFQYLQVL